MQNNLNGWAQRLADLLAVLGLVALEDVDPAFERESDEAMFGPAV